MVFPGMMILLVPVSIQRDPSTQDWNDREPMEKGTWSQYDREADLTQQTDVPDARVLQAWERGGKVGGLDDHDDIYAQIVHYRMVY